MIFLISFIVFAFILAAMAVGVIAGREPIKGSCGGIGALGIDQSCEICGGDPQRCETETRSPADAMAASAAENGTEARPEKGAVVFDPAEK
ncbi:hypothetical protein OMB55_00009570 [gamma proteobacterium HIMB55]|nr:hypothetical protein OMB55_00009570 [gamma proteobacterium HIMB55]